MSEIEKAVARSIYEADPDSGYDPEDPRTAWMAEDGYWPPSTKAYVWDRWSEIARAAIAAYEVAKSAAFAKEERQ